MSRHPSPGPSHPLPPNPQIFQQVSASIPRQKSKAYATGIAAGAEDVKYQAKYKELKRKVKEIEADNDKLQFKVLQAKRSIQRMKLERAVLYERLSVVPPSPDLPDRQTLPPIHSGPGIPPQISHNSQREAREHAPPMDANDHALMEYLRTHGNVRVIAGPDGRPIPVTDAPMGPGVVPGFPSRRGSASRQLPPLPHLPSVQHFEPTRIHGLPQSQPHSHPHASPHMHSLPGSSHERTRSHSSTSRSHTHPGSGHPFHSHTQKYSPETLPPVQHVLGSPSLSGDRERSRRHELHELTGSHGEPHGPRQQTPLAHSPPHSQTADNRGRVSVHRMGPGTYINRSDDHYDRDYERDKDREWDRGREVKERELNSARMHSPPAGYRSRPERPDSNDRVAVPRSRDEQAYYEGSGQGPGYSMLSRSGTPGSGSGSGSGHGVEGPSRPDSRAQIYDRGRMRYALRPVNQAEDLDFVHEDGRSPRDRKSSGGGGSGFSAPEQSRPSLDSRKRSRNDMEVEDDDAVEAASGSAGGGIVFSGGHLDDRGSKRFHQDATNPNRGDGEDM